MTPPNRLYLGIATLGILIAQIPSLPDDFLKLQTNADDKTTGEENYQTRLSLGELYLGKKYRVACENVGRTKASRQMDQIQLINLKAYELYNQIYQLTDLFYQIIKSIHNH